MKIGRFFQHTAFGTLIVLGLSGTVVSAAGAKTSATGTLQGYASDSVLQDGTIVELTGDDATKVAPATNKNLADMYGVTVDPHQLPLTISSANLPNEVYVATSGTYDVLVSDQNGAIKAGDYVTMSAVAGVAMKADTAQKTVFGRAVANFDGKTNTLGTTTLKDTTGATDKTVSFGQIPVAVDIRHNPNEVTTKANLPKVLQRVGEAVAEKPVGPLRIYLSIGITGLSIIISLVTLYSGIRSAIISIGRNPLGKKAIYRGLAEIVLTSFIILIIGLFAVYLLLKL